MGDSVVGHEDFGPRLVAIETWLRDAILATDDDVVERSPNNVDDDREFVGCSPKQIEDDGESESDACLQGLRERLWRVRGVMEERHRCVTSAMVELQQRGITSP